MATISEICEQAGFHGDALKTAVAIVLAESQGHATAHNTDISTGDNSYGLFQINMLGDMGPARRAEFGLTSNDQLFDPLTNAKAAFEISGGGKNFTPWSTYKSGAYQQYLGEDGTVDISGLDHVDVHPLPGSDPYGIDTGAAPTDAAHQQDLLLHDMDAVFGTHMAGLFTPSAVTSTSPTDPAAESDALHRFLDAAVAQRGDAYVFGAKGAPNDPNPKAFDCSGLTAWAAHQAGYDLPDGAAHQYVALKEKGMLIPVDQAIHTPGALLFHFATEPQPGTGEPEIAHVAISLGNGKTIEAADPQDGVTEFNAGGGRFNYAAVIPGISDATAGQMSTGLHPLADFGDQSGHLGPASTASSLMDFDSVFGVHTSGLSGGLSSHLAVPDEVDPGHDPGHDHGWLLDH